MKNFNKCIALTVILTQVFWSISGYANPVGGNVTSGSSITTTGSNTVTVDQLTDKLITNWQSFSIAAGETTRFNQPSSTSVALNRVVGGSPSDIFGTLSANGIVYLINQNGILFAPGSQVNVGGLLASTLDISDAQFTSGQYNFTGASGFGSVNNQGTININAPGGYAALLGSTVMNSGTITTATGTVALASGNEITVNLDPSGTISAVVVPQGLTANTSGSADAINNSGVITVNGGTVILTAQSLKGLFTNLVNNEGTITANSTSSNDGVVELLADGAGVSNSGAVGAGKNVDIQVKNGDFTNSSVIQAPDSINVVADGDINLLGGSIWATSPTGGNINIDGANVKMQGVVRADLGSVTIKSKDQILNTGSQQNGNVVAENLDLSAVNGIGATGSLILDVANVNALNTTSGKIDLLDATSSGGGLNVKSVINNGGSIGDDIFLKTNPGVARDIEVGKISASGLGNVNLDAAGSITDNDSDSMITGNQLSLTANNTIGSSTNRINTDVNVITAKSNIVGDIYLNQAKAVILHNLITNNGAIDVKTISGDIDAGTVNAAGGLGDVTLSAAGSITDNTGHSLVTANNFNFTSGNVVGTAAGVNLQIAGGHIVLNIQNLSNSATYNVFSRKNLSDPWSLVASNVAATSGASTLWTDPAALGTSTFYKVAIATATGSGVGTGTNRINTDVNTITGLSKAGVGGTYLNQAKAVTLSNVRNDNGVIDVTAGGSINASNVTTSGSAGDSITLKTTSGDIDAGTINAASGAADVNLSAAGSITDNTGHSLVTANNFNFTSGNVVGTAAGVNLQIAGGHIVLNIQNLSNSATYNVFSRKNLSDPWSLVASNVAATSGASTPWTDPATIGANNFYKVEIATATTSGVGTSTNRINTNANTINGVSNAGPGDIYLNSISDVGLASLNTNGSVDVTGNGNIAAGQIQAGNTVNLTASQGAITGAGSSSVQGNAVNLTSANGIGTAAQDLNVTTGAINAQVTGAGDVHLSDIEDTTLVAKAANGSVNVTGNGHINATDVVARKDVN